MPMEGQQFLALRAAGVQKSILIRRQAYPPPFTGDVIRLFGCTEHLLHFKRGA